MNIGGRGHKTPQSDRDEAKRLYQEYGSLRKVAAILGVSHTAVKKRLVSPLPAQARTCGVGDCGEAYWAVGLCHKHYNIAYRQKSSGICSVCGSDGYSQRGYCKYHYDKFIKAGVLKKGKDHAK